jgi:hypothetical protein
MPSVGPTSIFLVMKISPLSTGHTTLCSETDSLPVSSSDHSVAFQPFTSGRTP